MVVVVVVVVGGGEEDKKGRENDDDDLTWPISLVGQQKPEIKSGVQTPAKTLADVACKILITILYAAKDGTIRPVESSFSSCQQG